MTSSSSNLHKCSISEPHLIMKLLSAVVLDSQLNHRLFELFFSQICTPDLVVFLACSSQRLKERLLKRAEQQGRPDDNLKATQRRLMNFKQNAVPLVKYFQEKGLIITVSPLVYIRENLIIVVVILGFLDLLLQNRLDESNYVWGIHHGYWKQTFSFLREYFLQNAVTQNKIHVHVADMISTMSILCCRHKLLRQLVANPLLRNYLHERRACFETLVAIPVPAFSSFANSRVLLGWLSWEGRKAEKNYILTQSISWVGLNPYRFFKE